MEVVEPNLSLASSLLVSLVYLAAYLSGVERRQLPGLQSMRERWRVMRGRRDCGGRQQKNYNAGSGGPSLLSCVATAAVEAAVFPERAALGSVSAQLL